MTGGPCIVRLPRLSAYCACGATPSLIKPTGILDLGATPGQTGRSSPMIGASLRRSPSTPDAGPTAFVYRRRAWAMTRSIFS